MKLPAAFCGELQKDLARDFPMTHEEDFTFAERREVFEELGPYRLIQNRRGGFRLTRDTILLTEFLSPLDKDDSVIDLGTGAGIIPLILAWKSPAVNIVGVEVENGAASLARRNLELNGLSSRAGIVERDFRGLPQIYPEGAFTVVVSNPPYTKACSGRTSPVKERAIARSEVLGNLTDLINVSSYLAGKSGRIFYIFPVIRLFEMLDEVKKAGLRARRLKFVHTNPKKAAKLFLIEAGRAGELKVEDPVFL